jgi:tRNA(Ile)-lysidine synthase
MDALGKLGLAPEAIALSARRLRRARTAVDAAAGDFLARHAETSAAGFAEIDLAALFEAPEEIALRALSRLVAMVGGGVESVRLAKLETLLAALKAEPDTAHTLARCRIVPRAGRLFIFRELRKEGLPVLELQPGERTLWDNRFRIELGADAGGAITVRALGEVGLLALKEREALPPSVPRIAARTLPACWRGEMLLGLPDFGVTPSEAAPCLRHEGRLDCRATFLEARFEGGRAGTAQGS